MLQETWQKQVTDVTSSLLEVFLQTKGISKQNMISMLQGHLSHRCMSAPNRQWRQVLVVSVLANISLN